MDTHDQEGASCPVISKDWLEKRYGVVVAASIFAEIQRTDQMVGAANDTAPFYKVA